MKQQPELPDFVRDLEIVQSLNRNLLGDEDVDVIEDPSVFLETEGSTEISDDSV